MARICIQNLYSTLNASGKKLHLGFQKIPVFASGFRTRSFLPLRNVLLTISSTGIRILRFSGLLFPAGRSLQKEWLKTLRMNSTVLASFHLGTVFTVLAFRKYRSSVQWYVKSFIIRATKSG